MAYGCRMKSLRLQAHLRQTIGHCSLSINHFNSTLLTFNSKL